MKPQDPSRCPDPARIIDDLLGNLPLAESRVLEPHYTVCAACRAERERLRPSIDALMLVPEPIDCPPSVWQAIEQRIGSESTPVAQPWKSWASTAADGEVLQQPSVSGWQTTAVPGISVRPLSVDPAGDRTTMLVRMTPGARYPAHRHGGSEECWVLEGDLLVGDLPMQAGDFQRVEAGSEHPPQRTRGGCLLLISSSLSDELLE